MINSLKYGHYTATILYNSYDEVFYGKIIGINDLISFEGSSVSELKEAFKEAIEDYIETCKDLGKPPEKAYKGTFNVRVTPVIHRKAALLAAQHQLTLNDFVKTAMTYAINHEEDFIADLSK